MASATLLKSSFLPKTSEWLTARKSSNLQQPPTTICLAVRASAYSDELVKTAVCIIIYEFELI